MANLPLAEQSQWLSLGEACRLLQVSEVTLRQWADAGRLRVYRTPGGHRRFFREDLLTLTQPPAPASPAENSDKDKKDKLEGAALRRIRRRLNHEEVARQPWYQRVEAEGRDRMRLFGRRLLSLLLQEPPARRLSVRHQEALTEALMLGREYGAEMSERLAPVKDTLEAFIFFRSLALNSTAPRSWNRMLELTDQVLLGVVEAYQKRNEISAASAPTTTASDA